MKLDPVFTVKENKLYKISDNSPVDFQTLQLIEVKWSTVEMEDEQYNEEYLAKLRDQLKELEEENKFAVLVPVADKPLDSAEKTELFTNAYNHTARRVKDCVSVAGLALPLEYLKNGNQAAEDFMAVLAIKHAQYVYFAKKSDVEAAKLTGNPCVNSFVLY